MIKITEDGTVIKIDQKDARDCFLSVPKWDTLNGQEGYCRDEIRARADTKLPYRSYSKDTCLFSYEEHLKELGLTFQDNVLVTGVRNLGNNMRIIAWHRDRGLLELQGENSASGRIYTCFCKTTDNNFVVEQLSFKGKQPNRDDLIWAVSGQELVWDGKPNPIEKIIPYAYDLRHVWQIPGTPIERMGPKPYAGTAIEEMENAFVEMAEEPQEEIARQLIELAEERCYERDENYLHSAIGVSKDGEIIIFHQQASFENLADSLVKAGAWRAIEVQEGGSCGVMTKDEKLVFSSDYFRPQALSLLVFLLK